MTASTSRNVRLPDDLWAELLALAEINTRKPAQEIAVAIRAYVDANRSKLPAKRRRASRPTP